jgi:CDP-paratose 2-epimerase
MTELSETNRKGEAGKIGFVQWFHMNQFEEVERSIDDLKKINISQIRTNLSWADWHRPGGKEWYDWMFQKLGVSFKVLPCILYTPPSLGIKSKSSSPPADPKQLAHFVDLVITAYGKHFEYIELWNEPNNIAEYDFTLDEDWNVFCEMVGGAANWARKKGKKTVLGGMSPIDPLWLRHMFRKNLMEYIDVVGIHGFPGVFDYNWEGWNTEIQKIRQVLIENNCAAQLWITEAGFSTWQHNEKKQLEEFILATRSDAEKVFWYGLKDLSPALPAVDRYHLDEREYHFGIKHADNTPKLLFTLLTLFGTDRITEFEWMTADLPASSNNRPYTLITGGAGFVGTNLASRLLSAGKNVMVLDNLSRPGVEKNLFWLREKYPAQLQIMIGDMRDFTAVSTAVANAEMVYHFAAQVAVTSSLADPVHDFSVNAKGTLNILEAIRLSNHQPPIIYASTNKVYGDLDDVNMLADDTRYRAEDPFVQNNGINEKRNLEFHSPYGCTKGIADQYILDYSRSYGLQTMVFRMSCIYGPHQCGTEDQGWVAHFLIQALKNNPVTIYGDGKQVRDILYVDDLVDAFLLAGKHIKQLSGQAFNIGGGPENTISLLELLAYIRELSGTKQQVTFEEWRQGDQKYYVSDILKFSRQTGWYPETVTAEGIRALYNWLQEQEVSDNKKNKTAISNYKEVI